MECKRSITVCKKLSCQNLQHRVLKETYEHLWLCAFDEYCYMTKTSWAVKYNNIREVVELNEYCPNQLEHLVMTDETV